MAVLSVTTPAFLWASHPSSLEEGPVFEVQMKGSRLNVYGERLLSTPGDRVFFGAEDANYLFEPRLLDANDSRIQLILPFQPISGRYKLKIGKTEAEPAIDLVLVVDDSRILIDHTTKGNADALLTGDQLRARAIRLLCLWLKISVRRFAECPQTSTLIRAPRQLR